MERNTAGPGIESLTYCQTNRIKMRVKTVRWDTAGPGMKLLTCYQVNRTKVGVKIVKETQLDLTGVTNSLKP